MLYNDSVSITFSKHARRQLKRRNIPQKIVKKTVYNPKKTLSSFRGRKLRQRQVGSKILEVVTVGEKSQVTVITAYYLEEDEN